MEDFTIYLIILASSLFLIMTLSIILNCRRLENNFTKLKDIEIATNNIKKDKSKKNN